MGIRAEVGARRLLIFGIAVLACMAVLAIADHVHASGAWTRLVTGVVCLAGAVWMFLPEIREMRPGRRR